MGKFARLPFVALPLILALAFLSPAGAAPALAASQDHASGQAGDQRIVLTIEGLQCPYCAYGLRKRLLAIPGVTDVQLDQDRSRVVIEAGAGAHVGDDAIRNAIAVAHFSGGDISRQ